MSRIHSEIYPDRERQHFRLDVGNDNNSVISSLTMQSLPSMKYAMLVRMEGQKEFNQGKRRSKGRSDGV